MWWSSTAACERSPPHRRPTLRLAFDPTAEFPEAARTEAVWAFQPERVGDARPANGYTCGVESTADEPCRAQPLVYLGHDLNLDLTNEGPAPGLRPIALRAYHQPGADDPRSPGLHLWVSYDGGERWFRMPVLGHDVALALLPPSNGAVSMRVRAWDVDGNRVTETIHDAFGLRRGR